MSYANNHFVSVNHSKQSKGKQMRGGNILYDLKIEVCDCPGHQKAVIWENESVRHLCVTSLEIKWGCDIVQTYFNWCKASEKNPFNEKNTPCNITNMEVQQVIKWEDHSLCSYCAPSIGRGS